MGSFCLWIYLGWEEPLFHDSHVQYLLFMWVFPHTWRELEKLRVLPHCFHSWIFLDCESYYICMLSQDKQKNFYIPRTQSTLHRWAFDVFSMKLENQLTARLYHINQVYFKWGMLYIFSLFKEREVHCFFTYSCSHKTSIQCDIWNTFHTFYNFSSVPQYALPRCSLQQWGSWRFPASHLCRYSSAKDSPKPTLPKGSQYKHHRRSLHSQCGCHTCPDSPDSRAHSAAHGPTSLMSTLFSNPV